MPTKKTKEKVPKTKLKKPKAARVKKEKPAKTGKKSLLPKNKRVVILLVAALFIVIIGAAQAIILLSMKNKNAVKEKVAKAPDYYFSKDEDISSFTTIVGERTYEKPAPVPESSEETKKSGAEKKESDDAAKSGTEAEGKAASEGDTADKANDTYKYVHLENASADLKTYKDYLETQKSFIDVTKENTTAESTESETKSENAECYQLAGPSSDSKTYLSITLETAGDSVTVTAGKGSESWNDFFKKQWNEQKKVISDIQKLPKSETSIEKAENTVRSQGQEKLKLTESADSYQFIASPGITKIEGKNYYTVRTYKRLPDSTLAYVATYLCDCSDNSVGFQYDEVTGQTTPLG
ncbi:hypothetical protein [Lacrimispora defluvii]|uniref:Uncharacterized protein n=1 Tax=Lacrimispora defluvii TaxID=2719233 RepID=A0ABX1VZV3_9FIRM|nr:hypothetical protein [Lacrimispora defluvii]NNJ32357.1 hypothetical protein [Lacrimispora defluvii]